jgi:hypothetical protein
LRRSRETARADHAVQVHLTQTGCPQVKSN